VALRFADGGPARGSVGFGRCVSVCRTLLSGIVVVPSGAPIFAPLPGSLGCNTADAPAGDESAVRSLSADNVAGAAGVLNASADPLDFPDDL